MRTITNDRYFRMAVDRFSRANPNSVSIDFDEVTPQVTVGSVPITPVDVQEIASQGFGAVLDMCNDNRREKEFMARHEIDYKVCFVPDGHSPKQEQLDEVSEFIRDKVAEHKKIYVHCHAGAGRAPTATCAYLIRFCGFTVEQALQLLKTRRRYHKISLDQREGLAKFYERHHVAQKQEKK